MAFNQIDGPGPRNRAERRTVRAIQRLHGAEARKAQAKAKRDAKAGKRIAQDLARTIVFYAMPATGINTQVPDGVYLAEGRGADAGKYQLAVAGKLRAAVPHYVKAVSTFLKREVRLVSDAELPIADGSECPRPFRSIIVEVV